MIAILPVAGSGDESDNLFQSLHIILVEAFYRFAVDVENADDDIVLIASALPLDRYRPIRKSLCLREGLHLASWDDDGHNNL